MLFADLSLARRLEGVEARGMSEYPMAQRLCRPQVESALLPLSSGFAIFAGVDSPLTRAVGLGLDGPVDEDEFERMEEFFRSRGAAALIDVCPLADKSLVELLRQHGYHLREFNQVWYRPLSEDEEFAVEAEALEVREARPPEGEVWVRTVARGFAGRDNSIEQEIEISTPTFYIPTTRCFMALSDGQPVGGGVLWVHEGVAALYGGSTIKEFRKRGVQTALLRARLKAGVEAGCDLASVKTSPGTASQRNVERAGFRLAYSKAIMAREFED